MERSVRFRPRLKVTLTDAADDSITLRFFDLSAAQVTWFGSDRHVRAYGEPRLTGFGAEIVHPSYKLIVEADSALVREELDPVHPANEGVGSAVLRRLIRQALDHLPFERELVLLTPSVLPIKAALRVDTVEAVGR